MNITDTTDNLPALRRRRVLLRRVEARDKQDRLAAGRDAEKEQLAEYVPPWILCLCA